MSKDESLAVHLSRQGMDVDAAIDSTLKRMNKGTTPRRHYTFEVECSVSGFPTDMLRYDQCWPDRTEDALNILENGKHLRVRLSGIKKPTGGRWASFGCLVSNIQETTIED